MASAEPVAQSAARSARGRPAVPEAVWAPLAAGLLVLAPGLVGLALGKPVLFASLGPSAYLVAVQPQLPTSRWSNVVLGHLLGFAVGAGAVLLFGAADLPSVFEAKKLAPPRLGASVLAVAGSLLLTGPTRVGFHPSAAATTLLVTSGGFTPSWSDFGTVAAGTLIVGAAGEVVRRVRLAQPGQK